MSSSRPDDHPPDQEVTDPERYTDEPEGVSYRRSKGRRPSPSDQKNSRPTPLESYSEDDVTKSVSVITP